MPKYLTEKEVAELTGLSVQTLRNGRSIKYSGSSTAIQFPYVKIGKSVRYEADDVINFMEAHKIRPEER